MLVQGLMGPLVVEDAAEGVEGLLLRPQVRPGRFGGLAFEGAVHAFVPPVLLRLPGLDQLGCDPELDPPDGEAAQAAECDRGSERLAVVGTDALGKAVGAEEAAEGPHGGFHVGAHEPAAVEQEAAVGVLDRERIAELAVEGAELALEVGRPELVGSLGDEGRTGPLLLVAARLAASHEVTALENSVDRRNRGGRVELRLEELPELGRSPASPTAELDDPALNFRGYGMRAATRTMRPVAQTSQTLPSMPTNPFVTGGSADVVTPAQRGEGDRCVRVRTRSGRVRP